MIGRFLPKCTLGVVVNLHSKNVYVPESLPFDFRDPDNFECSCFSFGLMFGEFHDDTEHRTESCNAVNGKK